ncbi:2-aminoethylphosphonate--pyruvate transaminase [Rhodospirillum sp. A1_3_36]|uniref:2-aminoethylphosphonate--pyruvate transaminase n=1 Tax=Rhodospirillum sp. A1_3_36 TaxID=3391666 RepID=UPI0039A6416A
MTSLSSPSVSHPLRDPYLLTPGPLTTSDRTKQAMLRDWGSWDGDFKAVTARIRSRLVDIIGGGALEDPFVCVPMQGSGSFVVEAMLGTLVPRDGKVLVPMNGAYGQRMVKSLTVMGRAVVPLDKGDYLPPTPEEIDRILANDPAITHLALVHCETSSGILNPLRAIAEVVAKHGRRLLIDAMSSFGALSIDARSLPFDAVVASANKCLEGVPGFGWALVKRSVLEAAEGQAHSLTLDLHDQWRAMEASGQWRFTPPTHVVVALDAALDQYLEEGGLLGRHARYAHNRDILVTGLERQGFHPLLDSRWRSPIIVTFHSPAHPKFSFPAFYEAVKRRGFVLYPGKLTKVESFRVGCIGQVFPEQMNAVVAAMGEALTELGVTDASPDPAALAAAPIPA